MLRSYQGIVGVYLNDQNTEVEKKNQASIDVLTTEHTYSEFYPCTKKKRREGESIMSFGKATSPFMSE